MSELLLSHEPIGLPRLSEANGETSTFRGRKCSTGTPGVTAEGCFDCGRCVVVGSISSSVKVLDNRERSSICMVKFIFPINQ